MKFININKKNNLLLIVGWVITWLAIGVTPDSLINFKFSLSINLLNYFRGIFPIIYFILIIFYFFIEIKNDFFLKRKYILILLLFYFASQIIALIIKNSYYIDIYYLILAANSLLIISLKTNQKKNDNIFLFTSILFIFFLFLIFFYPQIKNFLHSPLVLYQSWGDAAEEKITFLKSINLDYTYPNILGFSRYVLILLLFIYFFKKKYALLHSVAVVMLASLLFLLQARATLLTYLIFVFLHPFLFKEIKFTLYLKKILLLVFIPLVVFYSLNSLKINFFFKQYVEIRSDAEKNIFEKEKAIIIRPSIKGNFTSDRLSDWKEMLNGSKKEFWGSGPQADRNYYNKTASNGLVYSFVCAGYFGLLFFLILCIYSFYISIQNLLIWRNLPSNFNILFYPIICLVFLIRSFFETSFAVFGIDFILFFYCLFMVQKFIKR